MIASAAGWGERVLADDGVDDVRGLSLVDLHAGPGART